MSSESPPPPPPPPPPPSAGPAERRRRRDDHHPSRALPRSWASEWRELHEAVSRFGLSDGRAPTMWRYTHVESLLQSGPTCGIVALCMLTGQRVSTGDVLREARERGFTNRGEMFSVRSMFELCKWAVRLARLDEFAVEHCKGRLIDRKYVRSLTDGCLMLVPYDSDFNHAPCRKKGHFAHWALITGILILESPFRNDDIEQEYDIDNIFVTAKQGKSIHLGVWKLKDLYDSNNNLLEVSEKRLDDELNFVIPETGLSGEEGLNGQFVLLRPKKQY